MTSNNADKYGRKNSKNSDRTFSCDYPLEIIKVLLNNLRILSLGECQLE